ncbi:hypothetical protein CVV43_04610 [Candidatus Saccharibacteria bacterium HGW-Saccharibacteria-1]|jgi:HSP20 family protein|nr:MAG: hypothetical protein CVV43_04610 [Candidatus Saccharibacteria bacterium HGW-Saccharibacteria-1]
MQLIKYNPFHEIQKLERDLDKVWNGDWSGMSSLTETAAMDMYEENGNLVAEVNLPNFDKSEIRVTTKDGALDISAEHKEKKEEKGKRRYFLRESSNQYFRRVMLPEGAKTEDINASFKDGMLKISMPMAEKEQPKAIDVK